MHLQVVYDIRDILRRHGNLSVCFCSRALTIWQRRVQEEKEILFGGRFEFPVVLVLCVGFRWGSVFASCFVPCLYGLLLFCFSGGRWPCLLFLLW